MIPGNSQEWAAAGFPCSGDCEGHVKGYEWAEALGISDPDECGGNSQSFIEGCRCYAQEQQKEQAGEGAAAVAEALL